MREIGVGLLGLGNVGAGVVKLLAENAGAIEARLGAQVAVRGIAVRELDKPRQVDVDPARLTTDARSVIDRGDVQIICELIGGETDARDLVLHAIECGKHVVTANKALLAMHGEEIFSAAEQKGVDVYFEAAVCAGVPIIRALREGLASDRIESITGIVNGTSNFILTAMAQDGRAFAEVLRDAQEAGYAEADPTLDVGGGDAAHKLAILATLCFGTRVAVEDILVEGIDRLDSIDFEYAAKFGYVIKPLAVAREHGDGIEARVHPAMLPKDWLLATVNGAKNALYVSSKALGPSLYYGAGAGMMPTAVAAVSDIIEVGRDIQAGSSATISLRSDSVAVAPGLTAASQPLRPHAESRSRRYMRFGVVDRPGVLGQLANLLGAHGISIAQVVQEGPRDPERPVQVLLLTHSARQGDVQEALAEIHRLDAVVEPGSVIRIAGEA